MDAQRVVSKLQELFQSPRSTIEGQFSPYFYRYFGRYKNPHRFAGYLDLCRSIFDMTHANGASVLDLGCGFGLMATIVRLYGASEVVGYDLNIEKIELFQRLLTHLGSDIEKVEPVLGDSSMISYPDQSFNVVIANESLSHIGDLGASIGEVYRVLKPGGSFLIRDGNNSLFLPGRVQRRIFWRRVEKGPVDPLWFRSTDLILPYVEIRKKMILQRWPEMVPDKAQLLAGKTAGMFGDEILRAVEEFEEKGDISKCQEFGYRNPITGEFPEREMNPFHLQNKLRTAGFAVSFVPYFYSESFTNPERAVKRVLYLVEKYIPIAHLFLTSGFGLLGLKRA